MRNGFMPASEEFGVHPYGRDGHKNLDTSTICCISPGAIETHFRFTADYRDLVQGKIASN
jgi:hypothetical protein